MPWETVEGHLKFRLATKKQLAKICQIGSESEVYRDKLSGLIDDHTVFVTLVDDQLAGYSVLYPIAKMQWVVERFFTSEEFTGCGVPRFMMGCMCDLAIYETKKHFNLTLVSGLEIQAKLPRSAPHCYFNLALLNLGFQKVKTGNRKKVTLTRILEDGFSGRGCHSP